MVRQALQATFVAVASFLIIGCGNAEKSVEGDAAITKDMPATQAPPASAGARQAAAPRGNAGLDISK